MDAFEELPKIRRPDAAPPKEVLDECARCGAAVCRGVKLRAICEDCLPLPPVKYWKDGAISPEVEPHPVADAAPVAWRAKLKGNTEWVYYHVKPPTVFDSMTGSATRLTDIEPLYAHPEDAPEGTWIDFCDLSPHPDGMTIGVTASVIGGLFAGQRGKIVDVDYSTQKARFELALNRLATKGEKEWKR